MNLQFYLEKLRNSEEYNKFLEDNPDAFPCSAFFVIDKEEKKKDNKKVKEKENKDKQHIDYFLPKDKKAVSFQLENSCKLVPIEMGYKENPEKIDLDRDIDFNEIEETIALHMEKENVKNKVQQILLSLQSKEGKDFLIGTVFISGFGLIKININLETLDITDFVKKSFFEMLNITGRGKEKKETSKEKDL